MRTFRRLLVVLGFVSSLLLTWLMVLADEPVLPASPQKVTERPTTLSAAIEALNVGTYYQGIPQAADLLSLNPADGSFLSAATNILPTGALPYRVTVNQNGSEVWTVGNVGDGVIVTDPAGTIVIELLSAFGESPVEVTFSKQGDFAYISNSASPSTTLISVIDTSSYSFVEHFGLEESEIRSVNGGQIAVHPCTGDLYMADFFDDYLYHLDGDGGSLVEFADFGNSLWDLTFHPNGERIYVTDRGLDEVVVIDAASFSEVTRIPTGDDPWGIAITPDGNTLITANEDDGTATIIDTVTNSVLNTVSLPSGSNPRDVDIDNSGTYAFLPSGEIVTTGSSVYVIDLTTNELVDSYELNGFRDANAVGLSPNTFSLDPIPSFNTNSPVANPSFPIQFTDTSGNNPTSWDWDFGDGLGMSTDQNPSYAYANEGRYTVTLTVTNECGSATVMGEVQVGIEIYLPLIKRP